MSRISNFHIRVHQKDSSGKTTTLQSISEVAFVKDCGYEFSIEQLLKEFKDMALPKDIRLELYHTWNGDTTEGSPTGIVESLKLSGYLTPDMVKTFFDNSAPVQAAGRKFIIYERNAIREIRKLVWGLTKLPLIDWTRTEQARKALSLTHPSDPFDWWM